MLTNVIRVLCNFTTSRAPDHVLWNPRREHKLFTDYSIFNTRLQNTPNYCISSKQGFPILWFSDRRSHAAICGINNLIIRNTEFTIRSVVPFVRFVFNMSICFSYYCRIGQQPNRGFCSIQLLACGRHLRSNSRRYRSHRWDLFKLHALISRWIKHVCTFQYREHPCYTRDLANHNLLSKRLQRIGSRRLYCATVTVYKEYFISCYFLIYLSDDPSTVLTARTRRVIFIQMSFAPNLEEMIVFQALMFATAFKCDCSTFTFFLFSA